MMRHSVDRPWLLTLTTTFQEVDRFFLLLWVRRKGRWNQAFFFLFLSRTNLRQSTEREA